MMKQWHECKEKVGEALLFFRMGDFYEAFYDDAVKIANTLNLVLTKRQEIPMCGVPVHSVEGHIDKLVSNGFRIAVAEQMEDPRKVKGLVKRDVVRLLSPATMVDSSLVTEKSHNYFVSVAQVGKTFGLSCVDFSCGTFITTEFDTLQELEQEVMRIGPKELLAS